MIYGGPVEKCLLSWIRAVQEVADHRLIAIDGKTLRGSYDRRDGEAAIHMVSARASENEPSLGQAAVDEKSGAITAIPELLRLLDVSGASATIDAMGRRKEIAADTKSWSESRTRQSTASVSISLEISAWDDFAAAPGP